MHSWKKIIAAVIIAVMLTTIPFHAQASNHVDITGGVNNEFDYEEYVFISGAPVLFKGTGKNFKLVTKDSRGKRTHTYTYSLKSDAGDTLERKLVFESNVKDYVLIGQTTINGEISGKPVETFKINGETYTLTDFQTSNALAIDNRPASDYFAGNIEGRKIYTKKNRDGSTERIVAVISAKNEGYNNFWGETETQINTTTYSSPSGNYLTVENTVSNTKTRTLNYEKNNTSLSSFRGGYVMTTNAGKFSTYKVKTANNEEQTYTIELKNTPKIERLIVPKFKDTEGSMFRTSIEQLYSLGIFDEDLEYFSPKLAMNRYEFSIALGKAIQLRVLDDREIDDSVRIFKDVARSQKDYEYLVAAYQKKVISGVSALNFDPNGKLNRQQAATIMIRALGLEGRIQDTQTLSNFKDRAQISPYARAAVSEAARIGLMNGVGNDKFDPKGELSRGQTASIIIRFLNYLQNDLKNNYQDDYINFN